MVVRLSLGVECSTKTKRPDPLTTVEALLSNPENGASKMDAKSVPNGHPGRKQRVYVMASSGGMVKVGMAFDPEERRKQLITGHPYDLSVAHIQEMNSRA
jgi:hypothetical protein